MAFAVVAAAADRVTLTVSNPLSVSRSGEMVEVPITSVKARLGNPATVIVTDADGKEIPSQVTYDGLLIFQAGVAAKGKSIYYVEAKQPQKYEPKVFGRQFPERADDMAWENDLVAFRCYGPQLQRNGERAFGYDIWNKRTSKLVVEQRYASELDADIQRTCQKLRKMGQGDLADDVYNAVSYHVDHGNGMDCYKVGPTLGAGTSALLDGGEIVYPYCYKEYKILDQGPLRFTVSLTYGASKVAGQDVIETRTISLDAGSQLNKAVVSYSGLKAANDVATGIIVHNENPTAYVLNAQSGYMAYEDLGDPNQYKEKYRAKQNKDFGRIYVGAVFPARVKSTAYKAGDNLPGATGHILAISQYRPDTKYVYYFGSGWSRNQETKFQSLSDWEAYLSTYAKCVKSPLKVSVK